jgi:predicted  nucleic acid-binding Zn-ribbon protein
MPRFDEDWDERVDELERELTQERRGAEAWERQVERDQQAYEDRLKAAHEERDAALAVLADLVEVVKATPFHAYCEWRARGGQADADKMNDWQHQRDAVFRRAQEALDG